MQKDRSVLIAGGGPVVNLPVVTSTGAYQFNISVAPDQTYYIDPLVAVGYVFETGSGDKFKNARMPAFVPCVESAAPPASSRRTSSHPRSNRRIMASSSKLSHRPLTTSTNSCAFA